MKITKRDRQFISSLFYVLNKIQKQPTDQTEKAIKNKAFEGIDQTIREYARLSKSFFDTLYSLAEFESEQIKDFIRLSEAKANERLNDYLGVCMCLKMNIATNGLLADLNELKELATYDLENKSWPKQFYRESNGTQRYIYVAGNPFEAIE